MIIWSKSLPDPDHFKHSVVISIIIHGSALAALNILTYGLWIAIALCGNVAYQFLFKLTQWPISVGVVLPAIQKFPITVGFVLASMACGSCGGLALICAVIIYFILLSKMYEDYLEEFVFKTAAVIAGKLFGKKSESENAQTISNDNVTPAITISPESKSTPVQQVNEEIKENEQNKESDESKKSVKFKESKKSKEKKSNETTEISKKSVEKEKSNDKIDNDGASTSEATELNANDDKSLVATDPENSFEVLYNQLDPDDVALFTEVAEPDDLDEETRQEIAKNDAGNSSCC